MNEQSDKNKFYIIIAILMVIAIIIMIIINVVTVSNEKEQENIPEENLTEEQRQAQEVEQLYDMDEYNRIKTYFNKYISYIENQDYQNAYNLLYDEFKQTYYQTLDEYINYVKNKYPYMISVEYNGVQRLGEYYVLDVIIKDILNATEDNTPSFEQKFVIYERDFDDFTLSFQAE